jgi:hypothetical protein
VNIKPWQIFIFSLLPLALVFAGVIIGSMHGIDSEKEEFPTTAPGGYREAVPSFESGLLTFDRA